MSLLRLLSALVGGAAAVTGWRAYLRRRLRGGLGLGLPAPPSPEDQALAERLGELIRIETVSHDEMPPAAEAFGVLHEWLETTYPKMHGVLEREVVGDHSLLFTWYGRDPDRAAVLLMAHLDVVPVEPGTEDDWTHPAFAALRDEGYLWGRGAMDDKASVVGIFEAVETMVGEGFEPERTVLLAFGHDEEIGGQRGAKAMADLLAKRGTRLAAVLDEGGFVSEGLVLGVRRPVALVGTSEKGFLSVILSADGQGGHSSAPPPQTSVGTVAAAVARLERNPLPARPEALQRMYAFLLPHLPLPLRGLYGNLGLVGPALTRRLASNPMSNALIRTTTAVTMIEGGIKQNVLPRRARAVVNFRILPGESVASTMDHVRRVVDDPRVTIEPITEPLPTEPATEASLDSPAFRGLLEAIEEVFPEAAVAPYTLIGMTDSRHYAPLADDVYRFAPFHIVPEDRQRIHGIDERIRLDDCGRLPRFYRSLLASWAGVDGGEEEG